MGITFYMVVTLPYATALDSPSKPVVRALTKEVLVVLSSVWLRRFIMPSFSSLGGCPNSLQTGWGRGSIYLPVGSVLKGAKALWFRKNGRQEGAWIASLVLKSAHPEVGVPGFNSISYFSSFMHLCTAHHSSFSLGWLGHLISFWCGIESQDAEYSWGQANKVSC